jgi:hypothetical protein
MTIAATPVTVDTPVILENPVVVEPLVKEEKKVVVRGGGGSDAVYGIGMIGAWVYYIGRAKTWQEGVAGFFKGLVWPAFLVYGAFSALNKHE